MLGNWPSVAQLSRDRVRIQPWMAVGGWGSARVQLPSPSPDLRLTWGEWGSALLDSMSLCLPVGTPRHVHTPHVSVLPSTPIGYPAMHTRAHVQTSKGTHQLRATAAHTQTHTQGSRGSLVSSGLVLRLLQLNTRGWGLIKAEVQGEIQGLVRTWPVSWFIDDLLTASSAGQKSQELSGPFYKSTDPIPEVPLW
jgi:hypothetical protein